MEDTLLARLGVSQASESEGRDHHDRRDSPVPVRSMNSDVVVCDNRLALRPEAVDVDRLVASHFGECMSSFGEQVEDWSRWR